MEKKGWYNRGGRDAGSVLGHHPGQPPAAAPPAGTGWLIKMQTYIVIVNET